MVTDIYFTILVLVGNPAALLHTYHLKQWSKYIVWHSLTPAVVYAYQCNNRCEKINTTVHHLICGI